MKLSHTAILLFTIFQSSLALPEKRADDPATIAAIKVMAHRMVKSGESYNCLAAIIDRQSRWDYEAGNPTTGSYGLFQAYPPDRMASAGGDWKTNPETQLEWGLDYIRSRYRTACAAWKTLKETGTW
ncbi:uncharacterized protein BJX67DRAFT_377211 [Aspergillus lucknowensis]|uniref:Transglycosylase SLT domain-containing protein n=1 Tax=Aspergillus lucknowensis TaxID=176173 RepID=A0ABR4M4B3_9EURO